MALKLGMTVNRLVNEMSVAEFAEWIRYFNEANKPAEPPALADMTREQISALFSGR